MNPLHKKLRLQPNQTILVINKPGDFESSILPLPKGGKITTSKTATCQHIYWFVKTAAEIKKQQAGVLALLKDGMYLWIFHPKGSSGIQTGLTRDKGWESLQNLPQLAWVSYIAFNDTWTAVAVRLKTQADLKKEAKPKEERLIFQYADSKTKTITLPDDLAQTLGKNKKAKAAFDALSFSNRREYVEWVVTAKREETRQARLKGTVEKLLAGLKNPAGR